MIINIILFFLALLKLNDSPRYYGDLMCVYVFICSTPYVPDVVYLEGREFDTYFKAPKRFSFMNYFNFFLNKNLTFEFLYTKKRKSQNLNNGTMFYKK